MTKMTVYEMVKRLSMEPVTLPQPEREISGVYVGDLLSWVMGRAQSEQAWVTIMSNINIVAVASLAELSCIVLAEGVHPDDNAKQSAEQKGINIVTTEKTAFEVAVALSECLK